jgi:integrase/recombinase XerD
MKLCANLSTLLHGYFTQRLISERHASAHTVASCRDTFRLLLRFAQDRLGKAPTLLAPQDLDAPFIGLFLNHLEKDRDNAAANAGLDLVVVFTAIFWREDYRGGRNAVTHACRSNTAGSNRI